MRRPRSFGKRFLPSPHDPFVPLSWRWQRACSLAQRRRVAWYAEDDDFVRLAVSFLRSCDRPSNPRQRRQNQHHVAVAKAHEIHIGGPSKLRLVLEARLLASQPIEAIACRTGLAVDAIKAYERLFFAVDDFRAHPDYLAAHTIGFRRRRAAVQGDREALAMVMAFAAGADAIDGVLESLEAPGAFDLGRWHPKALNVLETMLRIEAASLARTARGDAVRALVYLAVADFMKVIANPGVRAPGATVPPCQVNSCADLPSMIAAQSGSAEACSAASVNEGAQPMEPKSPNNQRVGMDVPEPILRRAGIQVADRDAVPV